MLTAASALALFMMTFASHGLASDFVGPPADQGYLSLIINRTLETERTLTEVPWKNPETGNEGTIIIDRTFYRGADRPCRNYRRAIRGRDGIERSVRGMGCRIGPGLWAITETPEETPAADAAKGTVASPAETVEPKHLSLKQGPKPVPMNAGDEPIIHRPKPKPEAPAMTEAIDESKTEGGKIEAGAEKPQFPAFTLPQKTRL